MENHCLPWGVPHLMVPPAFPSFDSGYNSPLASPFAARRAVPFPPAPQQLLSATSHFGSVDSLLVPGMAAAADGGDMSRAQSAEWGLAGPTSPLSPGSASSRASTPQARRGRVQRSPVRGLARACDSPGVAFCFPSSNDPAHLNVLLRNFRQPRLGSLSPQPADDDHMDVSDDDLDVPTTVASTPEPDDDEYHPAGHAAHPHHHPHRPAAGPHRARASPAVPRAPKPKARGVKQCACCGVTSTPLWRDVHGVSLCNACGIRFKKYGIICPSCRFVPCKNQQNSKTCARCAAALPGPNKRAKLPAC